MNKKLKIIFAGTPEFAVPALKALIKNHDLLAVISGADKPQGRGRKITPSPIKITALKHNLKIFDAPINQLSTEIKKLHPDFLIAAAYGQIISKEILDLPRCGAINLHPSLLPKYRGPSPIQASILNGDAETGASIIKMTVNLDAGPIIAQSKIKIAADETAGSLHDKLARLGAELLLKAIKLYKYKTLKLKPQDGSLATYTKKITAANTQLDPLQPAQTLERQIRAYNPWPGAWLKFSIFNFQFSNFNRLKVLKAMVQKNSQPLKSVKSIQSLIIYQNQPAVICGDGKLLILTEVQPEGKKRMNGEEFARGYLR